MFNLETSIRMILFISAAVIALACSDGQQSLLLDQGSERGSDPLPVPTPARETAPVPNADVIFQADYSRIDLGSDFELSEEKGVRFTHELSSNGGPDGAPSFEQSQISSVGVDSYGGQYTWGHSIELPAWPNNSSRFFRMRLRMDATNNYRAVNWNDGSVARSVNKFIHIGIAPGRFILNIEGSAPGANTWGWSLQLDGGAHKVSRFGLVNDQWYDIQIELRYGSEAYAKLWIGDMTYGSPWLQTPLFTQNPPSSSGSTGVGYFNNNGLASDGIFKFRHSDLEVGTSFDPSW